MEIKNLKDSELLTSTQSAAKREKQATFELLEHLREIEARDLALKRGFASTWEYVHKELGYSEAAASERMAAMRLLKRSGKAAEMIQQEKISLTVAAKLQYFIKAVEKTEARKVSEQETIGLIQQCAGKSKRETESLLVAQAPKAFTVREATRPVTSDLTELRLGIDKEFVELLTEAKALLGTANHSETIKRALKKIVAEQKKKPANTRPNTPKVTQPAALHSRYIPRNVYRSIWSRAQGQCEYQSQGGKRCESKHRLQADHILPFALGGHTRIENLRLLCANHNAAAARAWGLGWKIP